MPGTVDGSIEMDENPWASKECTERPGAGEDDDDEMVDAWNPDRPVINIMMAFLGKDVGLPRRWLPHTSATSMFWLILAQCELDLPETGHCSEPPPSWSTFWNVWASTWRHYLRLRTTSMHADPRDNTANAIGNAHTPRQSAHATARSRPHRDQRR